MVELCEDLFHSFLSSKGNVLFQNKFRGEKVIPTYLAEVSVIICNADGRVFKSLKSNIFIPLVFGSFHY